MITTTADKSAEMVLPNYQSVPKSGAPFSVCNDSARPGAGIVPLSPRTGPWWPSRMLLRL